MPMGVPKGFSLLTSILEKANAALPADQMAALRRTWMLPSQPRDNALTRAEQDFIAAHPEIRFRISSDRPPFELVHNGKPAGIAIDYIRAIADRTGFTPRFIVNDMPVSQAYDMMENDRTDFDTMAFSVKSTARAKRFAYGDTFMSYPMMIIAHKQAPYISRTADLQQKRVAVEKGFLTGQWLRRDYPDIRIVTAETTKAALEMVNDQKADAYVGNTAVASYMMTHGNMRNLKIAAPSDYGNIQYRFIAPRQWPELVSILSKGYRSLPADFHSLTQQKWFSVQMVDTTDYTLLWKIGGSITLIALWILWWNRRLVAQKARTEKALSQLQAAQAQLREKNDILKKLSVTDQLTGLYNRLKLDTVLKREFQRSQRYGNVFGVIIADIDRFKQVNDTYGHQTGDKVLTTFAGLIRTHVRQVDIVGRWGGEEFLIICPETDRQGVLRVAEDLRQIIAAHDFGTVGQVTASFGASIYTTSADADAVVSRADKALYLSKENGRNKVTFVL